MSPAASSALEQGPADSVAAGEPLPLSFTGRGAEYFGIWIVNLLLTVLTLGIYSAWAKVRRLQYFYRNTSVAGSAFDYHGSPVAILKGRLLALALLVLYNVSIQFAPLFGALVFLALAAVFPWLLVRSLRFRAWNTSWRGLRFGFDGTDAGGYRVFLLWPFLTAVSFYLLGPFWHQRMAAYQRDNARLGSTRFSFDGKVGSFYGIYIAAGLIFLGVLVVSGMVAVPVLRGLAGEGREAFQATVKSMVVLPLAVLGLAALFVWSFVSAMLQNLLWNHTRLGGHRFESRVRALRLFAIVATNFLAIVLTLGLFQPFAAVRLARYRLESVRVIAAGSLEEFVAGAEQAVAATGEEAAEMFDVDLTL